jgi:hypothetical protein
VTEWERAWAQHQSDTAACTCDWDGEYIDGRLHHQRIPRAGCPTHAAEDATT